MTSAVRVMIPLRSAEERERRAHRLLASALLEHVTVREGDAVEVPAQDTIQRARAAARSRMEQPDEPVRAEMTLAPIARKSERGGRRLAALDVEQRGRCTTSVRLAGWKSDHSFKIGAPRKKSLLDVGAPGVGRVVAELGSANFRSWRFSGSPGAAYSRASG